MAKTTIVNLKEIWESIRIFRITSLNNFEFWVNSFEDGIATVSPSVGCNISTFAEIVAGCFTNESNFKDEVIKAFDCDEENTIFTGIKFKFNDVPILVTKENADEDKIYEEWNAGMKANAEKYRIV
jgi:hypothetical protein